MRAIARTLGVVPATFVAATLALTGCGSTAPAQVGPKDAGLGNDAPVDLSTASDAASDAPAPPADASALETAPEASPFADAGAASDAARGEVPMFVAAGGRFHRIMSCDDGLTWVADQVDTSTAPDEGLGARGLGYGNGLFVASTGGGASTGRIFSTADGVVWTMRVPSGTYNGFSQVAYGNGYYVAGGGNVSIRSSTGVDGWGEQASMGDGGILRHLAFGGGKFVAVGGGRLEQSVDATKWAPPTSGMCAGEAIDVVFGNGHFVAVNAGGVTCVSGDGGLNWTNGSVGGTGLTGLVWTGHDFLARASSKTYRSPDGVTWTVTASTSAGPDLMAVSDKGTFAGISFSGSFYRSTDGLAWTKIPVTSISTQGFNRLVFGRGSHSSLCP